MRKTVVVIGGGVAGLSAAHELVERGFEVRVYERQSVPGGKARSVTLAGTGSAGRKDLPGEHGFRFFPRFYRHLPDTMKRIPYSGRRVYDNLVEGSRGMLARNGLPPMILVNWFPRSFEDLALDVHDLLAFSQLGLSAAELAFLEERLWQLFSISDRRALDELERIRWWDFMDADHRSKTFLDLFVHGFTRTLLAAKPQTASTLVVGRMVAEMIFGFARPGPSDDRLLCGPTNDVWIDPWVDHLRSRGVSYELGTEARAINCAEGQVASITVVRDGVPREVTADHYVVAVPVERMRQLLSPTLIEIDPGLGVIEELAKDVEWMNGIQFYLSRSVPIVNGHVICVDSAWSLSLLSQEQFWKGYDLAQYGDGTVRGIVSVDISDFDSPGIANPVSDGDGGVRHKAARECTPEEIRNDVWAQLKRALNVDGKVLLRDEDVRHWHLDSDIHAGENTEPLLVNKANSWNRRPEAFTGVPNLLLASDYVRTNTGLATMEGANEAARRAVNVIIDRSGSRAPLCDIWGLYEPWVLAPVRGHDAWRKARGLPWSPRPPGLVQAAHRVAVVLGRILFRERSRSRIQG